jgi:carbon storage regulator
MLVISRRVGETILIGPDIRITLVGVRKSGGGVRLGIEAPDNVNIVREEIVNRPPKTATPVEPAIEKVIR